MTAGGMQTMEGNLPAMKYPIFAIDWKWSKSLNKPVLLMAGGGGSSKSGILNAITICQLKQNHEKNKMELVELLVINTGSDLVTNAKFNSTANTIASGVGNHTIVYRLDDKISSYEQQMSFQTDFKESESAQNQVMYSPDNSLLATGGEDGIVRIWKMPAESLPTKIKSKSKSKGMMEPLFVLKGHQNYIVSLDWNESGTLLVTSAKDGQCIVWNAQTGKKHYELVRAKTLHEKVSFRGKIRPVYMYKYCRFFKPVDAPEVLYTLETPTRGDSFVSQWTCPEDSSSSGLVVKLPAKSRRLIDVSGCNMAVCAQYIGIGGSDGAVTTLDTSSMRPLRQVTGHHLPVSEVIFEPPAPTTLSKKQKKKKLKQKVPQSVEVALLSGSLDYSIYLSCGRGSYHRQYVSNVLLCVMILCLAVFVQYYYTSYYA